MTEWKSCGDKLTRKIVGDGIRMAQVVREEAYQQILVNSFIRSQTLESLRLTICVYHFISRPLLKAVVIFLRSIFKSELFELTSGFLLIAHLIIVMLVTRIPASNFVNFRRYWKSFIIILDKYRKLLSFQFIKHIVVSCLFKLLVMWYGSL